MDTRIVVLLGAHVGREFLTEILNEDGLSSIEVLDFLLGPSDLEDRIEHPPVYPIELMFEPRGDPVDLDMPRYFEAQHYRDLEYPKGTRRSQVLRHRSSKK